MSFHAQALKLVAEIEHEFDIAVNLRISADPAEFLQQLVDWAEFNAQAAYNVLLLSAEIGLEQPFGPPSDSISALVCAAATVDEMGTQATGYRDPHTELRKGMLIRAAEFYALPLPAPRSPACRALAVTTALYQGEGVPAADKTVQFAGRLGAHVASEKSAVQEFLIVSQAVEAQHSALLNYLHATPCPGLPVSAATWLVCHGGADGVEEIHSGYAVEAAALAAEAVAASQDPDTFATHFYQSVRSFYAARQEFFRKL